MTLQELGIDWSTAPGFSVQLVQRLRAFVVRVDVDRVILAAVDPRNVHAVDEAVFQFGRCRAELTVISEEVFEEALSAFRRLAQ